MRSQTHDKNSTWNKSTKSTNYLFFATWKPIKFISTIELFQHNFSINRGLVKGRQNSTIKTQEYKPNLSILKLGISDFKNLKINKTIRERKVKLRQMIIKDYSFSSIKSETQIFSVKSTSSFWNRQINRVRERLIISWWVSGECMDS